MNDIVYIHYGSDKFVRGMFKTFDPLAGISGLNKPRYGIGLWACRVDCDFGWKDWCEAEDFHTEKLEHSFKFTLDKGAKILTVRSNADINRYTKPYDEIDFNAIVNAGYDGVELIHGDRWEDLHYGLFYSWDVDSIVIWNPDVIEEIKEAAA